MAAPECRRTIASPYPNNNKTEDVMLKAIVSAVSVCVLSGCSNFKVIEPQDGAVFIQPATVPVLFEGNPRITNSQVTVGASTVSGAYVGSNRWQANPTLPPGTHNIAIEADVPCSYCAGQSFKHRATRTVCVTAPGSLSAPLKTPLAQADNQTWASQNATRITIEPDAGNARTRWNFIRIGGVASSDGLIESAGFPCHCLRSMEDKQNAPIGFWACNTADPLQQWQALPVPAAGPNRWRIQNRGRGVSDACLTEGPAPDRLLIQRACNDTPEQLWTIRDNTTGQPGSPFF